MTHSSLDQVPDPIRSLLAWRDSAVPKSVQMLRFHLNYDGEGVVLPDGFDELPDSTPVTKNLFAEILHLTINASGEQA